MKKYIVDTSVVIERVVSRMIKENKIKGKILVPHAVVSELEAQANRGLEIGFIGLEELQELQKLQSKELEIEYIGERPDEHQIRYAKSGEIDAYIRNLAKEQNAILITGDKVQAESAKAFGLEVMHLQLRVTKDRLTIEEFFDDHTMSVHIKEGCLVYGKKGLPGHWELVPVNEKKLTGDEIEAMTKEIFEKTRVEEGSFVEISRKGSTIIQHKNFRIVIVRPPVSDGWEITVVRPLKKLNIEDYNLDPKVKERLEKSARGVMIAGETGSGKCLPQGTPVYLKDNIVKPIEEVKVGDEVLTYGPDCSIIKKPVKQTFTRKVNKTINIKTNFGKELELTPEHPLLSFDKGYPEWTKAQDLTIGSKIATVRKLDNTGRIQPINWVELLPAEKVLVQLNKDIQISIPIENFFLGLEKKIVQTIVNGHGNTSKAIRTKLSPKSGQIRTLLYQLTKKGILQRTEKRPFQYAIVAKERFIQQGDILLLTILKELFSHEEIYQFTAKIYKFNPRHFISSPIIPPRYLTQEICELIGGYIGESLTKYGISTDSNYAKQRFKDLSKKIFDIDVDKKRKWDVYTDKYGTIELFLTYCLDILPFQSKKRATNHQVPRLIQYSPKIEIASFLRAYLDTESYIHPSKGLEVTSASKDLITSVQCLLLQFNISSSINIKIVKNKPYYRLQVYGYEQNKRLNEELGFIEKAEQLQTHLHTNSPGSPNKDTIPIGKILKDINDREKLHLKSWMFKRGCSHQRAQQLIRQLEPLLYDEESIQSMVLLQIASSDYILWEEIIAIDEKNNERDVYDIEVEETHNFLAGKVPFIVHNSTFCQALGEYYASKQKIVKTVESPRDLQLKDEITQYSKNFADSEEIHDILFLSRPDYILYDEIRDTPDFELYKDLRLGGSNALGVLHAAAPIDAVQRCVGRYETGMIPSILDTIIYIAEGKITKLLTLKMVVKTPSGMTEADLARPVVEVRDFLTNKLEFEIYSYGDETIVIPVQEIAAKKSGAQHLAAKEIKRYFQKLVDSDVQVEVQSNERAIVYVPEEEIARIIGRGGKNIEEIESSLGISLDIRELANEKREADFKVEEQGKNIVMYTEPGMQVEVLVDGRLLMTAYSSKKGDLKVHTKSAAGRELLRAMQTGRKIEVKI